MRVAIDACVLYAMPLADTLLRLAEPALGLYEVTWSEESLEEMTRVFLKKNRPQAQAHHRADTMLRFFPDATIRKGERAPSVIPLKDEADRHVIDAARAAGAEVIVTFNLSDFPEADLAPLNLHPMHPDAFLADLAWGWDADVVLVVLEQQAEATGRTVERLLDDLATRNACAVFATIVRSSREMAAD